MSRAAVIVVLEDERVAPAVNRMVRDAQSVEADELIVVVSQPKLASDLGDNCTVLLDESNQPSLLSGIRVALDWCARERHETAIVGLFERTSSLFGSVDWQRVGAWNNSPIVVGARAGRLVRLFKLEASAWSLIPLEGSLERLWAERSELIEIVDLDDGSPVVPIERRRALASDIAIVEELLGRPLAGAFTVARRDREGVPLVIKNAPFLDDGTPMPTTYWLVGKKAREAVGRLEANGGIREAEATIDPSAIEQSHANYATLRNALIEYPHDGPLPSGGVGGTRVGIKCLHAHLAYYLVGGADPVGRWVAHRLMDEIDGSVAAIDCGTNSTRLLIVDEQGVTLQREMRITRLGEDVDHGAVLVEEAMDRTLSVLGEYREVMDRFGVVGIRAVATSAVRDAANGNDFLRRAGDVLGVIPELLSGDEEGQLCYLGATSRLPLSEGPYLVVDLGGGSTELIAGGAGKTDGPSHLISLPIGCVRITERFFVHDPPLQSELEAARNYVADLTGQALRAIPGLAEPVSMIGVAGTVSSLASLCLGAEIFDEGKIDKFVLGKKSVATWCEALGKMTPSERLDLRGLEQGRADVITGGVLVLDELMALLGYDELTCSVADILDGIVASLSRLAPG